MSSKNWKAVESKVAKAMGGRRIPLSGSNNLGLIGDVIVKGYNVEVKSGRQIPKKVTDWLETIRALREDGKLPILVMQPFRMHERIVCLTLSDFQMLLERISHPAQKDATGAGDG